MKDSYIEEVEGEKKKGLFNFNPYIFILYNIIIIILKRKIIMIFSLFLNYFAFYLFRYVLNTLIFGFSSLFHYFFISYSLFFHIFFLSFFFIFGSLSSSQTLSILLFKYIPVLYNYSCSKHIYHKFVFSFIFIPFHSFCFSFKFSLTHSLSMLQKKTFINYL
jgi:hypothetical protein